MNKKGHFEYIIIENLSSIECLNLDLNSAKEISFKNLYALKELNIISYEIINLQTDLFDNLPNIEKLSYHNNWMEIDFENVKKRINVALIKKDSNFDLIMNTFCNRIEKFNMCSMNIESITKLLNEYHFQNLLQLEICFCDIIRIEKKFVDVLPPSIKNLHIFRSNLQIIDHDAFSNLKQLVLLDLSVNQIKCLDERIFSDLKNVKKLNLWNNNLEVLNAETFVGLENLTELDLSFNQISHFDVRILDNLPRLERIDLSSRWISIKQIINKTEVMNRLKELKIEFKI